MKRSALVRILEQNGGEMIRHGANHDIYLIHGRKIAIPRHTEIKENLAKEILKEAGLK